MDVARDHQCLLASQREKQPGIKSFKPPVTYSNLPKIEPESDQTSGSNNLQKIQEQGSMLNHTWWLNAVIRIQTIGNSTWHNELVY